MFVCLGDDGLIAVVDTKTLKEVGELPSGPDPEQLRVSPVWEARFRRQPETTRFRPPSTLRPARWWQASFRLASSLKVSQSSPDGSDRRQHFRDDQHGPPHRLAEQEGGGQHSGAPVRATPSTTRMAPSCGCRPRSAERSTASLTRSKHVVAHTITFEVPGLARELIQPVGIRFSADGKLAFVAMGPANRVAVIDAATKQVLK